MAKIRTCRLSWKPSESDRVIGYRLYWARGLTVTYDSNFLELGKVTEVYLPEVLKLGPRYSGKIMLGVTAVDIYGNESDMVVFPKPYRLVAPPAPGKPVMMALDDFAIVDSDVASPPAPVRGSTG